VDEAARVRRLERRADLPDDPQRATQRQRALAREHRLQVAPVDTGHRDVEEIALFAGVVDGEDARVVERGGELGFAQEPLAEVRLPQSGGEQLQRRRPTEPHVLGSVDDARSAAPERLDDAVAAELRADAPVKRHLHEF
jgi:hypothetical protein